MDILYTGRVDGFCIVSSDSDFTRLATRLREAGMKVFGLGERKTPPAFISACDKFIYIEILKAQDDNGRKKEAAPRKTRANPRKKSAEPIEPPQETGDSLQRVNHELVRLIISSVNDLADENGWAFLGDLGNLILKKKPDFDPRNYGFKKLVLFIESLKEFEINKESSTKGNTIQVYVRVKGQS
jgi:Fe-S-cluster formation regulator IscX/YfhJ